MEPKKIYLTLIILLGFNFINKSFGQATSAGNLNIPTAAGEFLGWAATSNQTLYVKNEDDYQIEFWISGQYRAKIGNSSEFSLIVGDGVTLLYNNIDISTTYAAPATEGYRYGAEIILSAPNYDNLICGLQAGVNTTGNADVMVL